MMRYVAQTVSVVLLVSLGFGHEVQMSSKMRPSSNRSGVASVLLIGAVRKSSSRSLMESDYSSEVLCGYLSLERVAVH